MRVTKKPLRADTKVSLVVWHASNLVIPNPNGGIYLIIASHIDCRHLAILNLPFGSLVLQKMIHRFP